MFCGKLAQYGEPSKMRQSQHPFLKALCIWVRIQVLNDELRGTFSRWYPGMKEVPLAPEEEVAA
jgi:hypothetical protein